MNFGRTTRLTPMPFSAALCNWMRRQTVRSVQRGTITVVAPALTNTATITSVDPSHSRLINLGTTTDGDGPDGEAFLRLSLTNATTITATRGMADTGDATVSYEILEYFPGVMRTVQRGTVVTLSTATITAVTTTRATLDNLGSESTVADTDPRNSQANMVLTNSTTITATRNTNADTNILGYQVIEWW